MARAKLTLPQLIAEEIRLAIESDSESRNPNEVIRAATSALAKRRSVLTAANWQWALRQCVRSIYVSKRHSSRPTAQSIEARKAKADVAVLPGWEELLHWPIHLKDGTDIPAAFATLAQIEFGAGRYRKLGRENAVKGEYLTALSHAMHAGGLRPDQTVKEFYARAAAA